MLSTDDVINLELLHRVINAGHSRLPVYNGTNKQARVMGRLAKRM
jgi:Mg2+/Co2+ transporter CorC